MTAFRCGDEETPPFLIAPALAAGIATQALAAGNMACSQRDDVLAQLASRYGEQPTEQGLANNGGLLELLTSDHADDGIAANDSEIDTWTLIVSMPNGTSCLLAAGEGWQVGTHLSVPAYGDGI